MQNTTWLIITSIASPNDVLRDYARTCGRENVSFVLVGDRKSPSSFALEHCTFLGLDAQRETGFGLAAELPENMYSRKNLGYLHAAREGAAVIIETDDDNLPYPSFWEPRTATVEAPVVRGAGWVNAYSYFTEAHIWPRGFSLQALKSEPPALDSLPTASVYAPIQQGLADDNPDVDAIYRLTLPLPIRFQANAEVCLGPGTICPFNSQNTTWFRPAFPLLYLPSFCSFRMTDIWRSFVAQRIAWEYDWHLLFHRATVRQDRNEHDLLKDFMDEVPGYQHNARLMEALTELRLNPRPEAIGDNLLTCYQRLVTLGLFPEKELDLLRCWLQDLNAASPLG